MPNTTSEEKQKAREELIQLGWAVQESDGYIRVTDEGKKAYLMMRRKLDRDRAASAMIPRNRSQS